MEDLGNTPAIIAKAPPGPSFAAAATGLRGEPVLVQIIAPTDVSAVLLNQLIQRDAVAASGASRGAHSNAPRHSTNVVPTSAP